MRYENTKFVDETLVLDGNQYIGCTLERCSLIYRGTGVTEIGNCSFIDSRFTMDGAAANTLNFLSAIYHGGFQSIVEQTFNNIRSNNRPAGWTVH